MAQESNLPANDLSSSLVGSCGIRTFPGGRAAVFSVAIAKPTPSRIFMEIAWADDASDCRAVVFVETGRFVAAWRREPYGFDREAAYGTLDRSRLELEKKYQVVENDFARSRERPVPLAQVICRKESGRKIELADAPMCGRRHVSPRAQPYYVDFNTGVTRTVWLIANGAGVLPVEIDSSEAAALHDEAGFSEMPPATVGELFEATRNLSFDSSRCR